MPRARDRRVAEGPAPEAADVGRGCVRPPTSCARHCSTFLRRESRAHECWMCMPARARSASRRSAAARRSVTFIEEDRRAQALIAENLAHLRRREWLCYHPGECRSRAQETCSSSFVRTVRHRAARSAVRVRESCKLDGPARRRDRCWRGKACSSSNTRGGSRRPMPRVRRFARDW